MKSMSIVEFSKTLGLSPTTVSQAINGRGRVSPVTREMVRRRMQELGYVPNLHAQQLVTGRSQMAVLHHTDQELLSDLFLVELAQGVQLALHRRGYGMLLDTASNFQNHDDLLNRWLMTGAVDGTILIQGWSDVRDWVRQYASARTPVVVYGGFDRSGQPYVGNFLADNCDAVRAAAAHLVEHGHRRIAYIGILESDPTVNVFRDALASLGVTLNDDMTVYGGFTPSGGAVALRTLLANPNPPTAVFCRKDDLAIGALNAAAQMGVMVPEQLSLIGHDDVPFAAITDPPLTTIRIDCSALGEAAAALLFELLESPESEPERRVIHGELIKRSTVAKVG